MAESPPSTHLPSVEEESLASEEASVLEVVGNEEEEGEREGEAGLVCGRVRMTDELGVTSTLGLGVALELDLADWGVLLVDVDGLVDDD